MKYGYVRASTEEQETLRQEIIMKELGVDTVIIEKESGKNLTDRPKFQALLQILAEGDTLVVESISRIARSVYDFLTVQRDLTERGVTIISKKEQFDTSSPYGQFAMQLFAAMYEMERKMMLDRQREGIQAKMAEGYVFGRPKKQYDKELFKKLVEQTLYKEISQESAAGLLGLSLSTFIRERNEYIKAQRAIKEGE